MQSGPIIRSNPIFFSTRGPSLSRESTFKIVYSFNTSPKTSENDSSSNFVHLIAIEDLNIDALYTVEKLPRNLVKI